MTITQLVMEDLSNFPNAFHAGKFKIELPPSDSRTFVKFEKLYKHKVMNIIQPYIVEDMFPFFEQYIIPNTDFGTNIDADVSYNVNYSDKRQYRLIRLAPNLKVKPNLPYWKKRFITDWEKAKEKNKYVKLDDSFTRSSEMDWDRIINLTLDRIDVSFYVKKDFNLRRIGGGCGRFATQYQAVNGYAIKNCSMNLLETNNRCFFHVLEDGYKFPTDRKLTIKLQNQIFGWMKKEKSDKVYLEDIQTLLNWIHKKLKIRLSVKVTVITETTQLFQFNECGGDQVNMVLWQGHYWRELDPYLDEREYKKAMQKPYHKHCNQCGETLKGGTHECIIERIPLTKTVFDVEAYLKQAMDSFLDFEKDRNQSETMYNAEYIASITNKIFFLAGPAGSGKTSLLLKMEREIPYIKFTKLAYTAKAAEIINGRTIDKFLLEKDEKEEEDRLKIPVIFLDEISMISLEKFQKLLDKVGAKALIIVSGDFNQLPFICDDKNKSSVIDHDEFAQCEVYYMYQNLRYMNMTAEQELFLTNVNEKNFYITEFLENIKSDQLEPLNNIKTKTLFDCFPILCNSNKEAYELSLVLYKNTQQLDGIIHEWTKGNKEFLKEKVETRKFSVETKYYGNQLLKKNTMKYMDVIFPHVFYMNQKLRILQNIYLEGNRYPYFINNAVYKFKGFTEDDQMILEAKDGQIKYCDKITYNLKVNGEIHDIEFFPVMDATSTTIHRVQGETLTEPYYIKVNKDTARTSNSLIVAITRADKLSNIRFLTDAKTVEDCFELCSDYHFQDYNIMEVIKNVKPYGQSFPMKTIFKYFEDTGQKRLCYRQPMLSIMQAQPIETFESPCKDQELLSYFTVFWDLETGAKQPTFNDNWSDQNAMREERQEIIPYCVGFLILYQHKWMDVTAFLTEHEIDMPECICVDGVWRIMAGERTMELFVTIITTLLNSYYKRVEERFPIEKTYNDRRWPEKIFEIQENFKQKFIPPITMIAHNGARFDNYFWKNYYDKFDSRLSFKKSDRIIPGTGCYSDMMIRASIPVSNIIYTNGKEDIFYGEFTILHHWDSVKFSLCSLDQSVGNYLKNISCSRMEQMCRYLNLNLPNRDALFNIVLKAGKGHYPHKACLLDINFALINEPIDVHKSYYFEPPDEHHETFHINPFQQCQSYITSDILILLFLVITLEFNRLYEEKKTSSGLRFITVQQKLKNDVYSNNPLIRLTPKKFTSCGCVQMITNVPKTPIQLSLLFDHYLYGGITLPRIHIHGPGTPQPFSTDGSYEPYFKGDINGMYSFVQSVVYYPMDDIIETSCRSNQATLLYQWIKRQEEQIKIGKDPDTVVMLARKEINIPKFFIMEATYKITNSMESPMSFRHNKDLYHGLTLDPLSSTRQVCTDYVSCGGLIMFGWELQSIDRLFLSKSSNRVYKTTVEQFDEIKRQCSPDGETPNPAKRNAAKLDSNALYGLNLRKDNDMELAEFDVDKNPAFKAYIDKTYFKYNVKKVQITKNEAQTKVYVKMETDLKNREFSDFSTSHGYMTLKGSHHIINRAMVYGYGQYLIPKTKEEFEEALKHRPLYGDTDSLVMPHRFLMNLWQHDLDILKSVCLSDEEKDELCFFYHSEYPFLRPGGKFADEERPKNAKYKEDIPNKIYTHIQGFVTNAPKSYSLMAMSPENQVHYVSKIKGIPGTSTFEVDNETYKFKKTSMILYEQFHYIFSSRIKHGLKFTYHSIVRQGMTPYIKCMTEDGEWKDAKHFEMFSDVLTRQALNDWENDSDRLKYQRMQLVDNVFLPVGFKFLW